MTIKCVKILTSMGICFSGWTIMKRFLCTAIAFAMIFGCAAVKNAAAYSGEFNEKLYICTMADTTIEYLCPYSDSYFYRDNKKYSPKMSVLSLAMSMSAFSSPEYMKSSDKDKFSADSNIRKTYKSMGFRNAEFYNYNVPITSMDDKVAFAFAQKEISGAYGKKDTLLSVIIRGGNYGGEWVSNLHIFGDYDTVNSNLEHYGFRTAAKQVYEALNEYIRDNRSSFKGDVKLWISGYSRGASVANLISHTINTGAASRSDLVSQYISPENIYSYQFACPAGARECDVNCEADKNIFVINSPSDVIPMMAPEKWGFSTYGNIIYLPDTMSDTAQQYFNELLKDTKYEGVVPCSPEHTQIVNQILEVVTDSVSEQGYFSLQSSIMKAMASSFEGDSQNSPGDSIENNELISAVSNLIKLKYDFDLQKTINGALYAHFPEHYMSLIHDDAVNDIYNSSDNDSDKDSYLIGDVNQDGQITLEDVVEIQKYLAKLVDFNVVQSAVADASKDSEISLDDVVLIQKYIAQLITQF